MRKTRAYELKNPFLEPTMPPEPALPQEPALPPGPAPSEPALLEKPAASLEPFPSLIREASPAFPPEPSAEFPLAGLGPRRVYTVTELTRLIQALLEETFASVWVEGEVSEPKVSARGHLFFTLKDASSVIRCLLWREARESLKFTVEQGMKAICLGKVSVYPQRGDYQLYVDHLEPKGIGALQLAFEQLKEKLQKQGLFDEARKRPLPIFPERIGIVTSPIGAAIQDILKILKGHVRAVLRPVRVQGEGAAQAIATAIKELNDLHTTDSEGPDLVIVGRGGGSLEDLWAFNEEIVARAIAASRLPVISAVGHEKDVTISDLVADVRAPTPTKAAEMVLAQRQVALDRLLAILETEAFTEPEEWLKEWGEQVDGLEQELLDRLQEPLLTAATRAHVLGGQLLSLSPQAFILHQAERLYRLHRTLESDLLHHFHQAAAQVFGLAGRLNALSPLAVLKRGYSITFDPQGRILKEANAVKPGELIQTQLHRGRLTSRVEETQKGSDPFLKGAE